MPKLKAKIPITQRNTLNKKKVNDPPSMICCVTNHLIAMPPKEISNTESTSKAPMMISIRMAKQRCTSQPFSPNPLGETKSAYTFRKPLKTATMPLEPKIKHKTTLMESNPS